MEGKLHRRYKVMTRKIFSFLAVFLFTACAGLAADVHLAWDASATTEVIGYKMYVGSNSHSYSTNYDVGNALTYTVIGLGAGTWYFAVTAYVDPNNTNFEQKESAFSNEVSTTISAGKSCDVNADGSINVLDLQALANLVASGQTIDLMFDLNSDGVVNVLDVQLLANVIAGKQSCP